MFVIMLHQKHCEQFCCLSRHFSIHIHIVFFFWVCFLHYFFFLGLFLHRTLFALLTAYCGCLSILTVKICYCFHDYVL